MGPPAGVDEEAVTAWLADSIGLSPPLSFDLVAGGRSNLTYIVSGSDGETVVLRRPPVHSVLPTAHDMAREYRVISALWPTEVPVPRPIASCADASVIGAPFYVMEYVEGHVVRDPEAAEALGARGRGSAGDSLVDVLAALHRVDPDSVGLGDFGRREGYLERQLLRWHRQFDSMQVAGFARPDVVDEVFSRLMGAVPPQRETTVVHGDYRLDNTILSDGGDVSAVIDWEISTLGDPLADVGLLLVYWTEPGDTFTALDSAPTTVAGFASRADLAARYAQVTGRDLGRLEYYVAFGYWKLACILQGVLARYKAGAGGGDPSEVDMFGDHVTALATASAETLAGARRSEVNST